MTEWWQEAVVYQVYPRSFRDTNGDGVGDLAGVTEGIDYLQGLGIDAVWLSPFYPSPMDDFGYDVADYTDVDPMFGTLADFDRLLASAHDAGIRVIVDLVPNHTSNQHPWFVESRSSRASPKRDWYVWADGPEPPNNWLSVFGGPAWEWDAGTEQFYLHSFLRSQPDLNWRSPEVEEAMLGVMRFWLDRGVDGFRIDVAHFMMKDPEMRDNPEVDEPPDQTVRFKDLGAYASQQHLYDKGHPDVHGVFRSMRRVLDEYGERFAVGEIHDFDPETWASYYGDGDGLHMPFNFALLYPDWEAAPIRTIVDRFDALCRNGRWPNWVLGNHDEPRLVSRLGGEEQARAAAVMLLTLRGTPTIYYGDELGMPEAAIPADRQVDPWGLQVPGLGRDGCRTPMQWDDSPGAGFTSGEPWLPLGSDWATRNVAAQQGAGDSMLELYRSLLQIRRERPALRVGDYRSLDLDPAVFGYERSHPGERPVVVVIGFDRARVVSIPITGRVVVSTRVERVGEIVDGSASIGAHEALVVEALD